MMRQTKQMPSFSAQVPNEPKVRRKLSLKPETSNFFEELIEKEDLKVLGNYIQCNIQSKRKNILQLYSTTISFLEQTENAIHTQVPLSPAQKKCSKRRPDKEILQPLSPKSKNRNINPQFEKIDNSMIVSNKFPEKISRPKIFLQRLDRLNSKKMAKADNCSMLSSQQKDAAIVQKQAKAANNPILLHLGQFNFKAHKIRKPQEAEKTENEINPWEYLIIPEEPYSFNA